MHAGTLKSEPGLTDLSWSNRLLFSLLTGATLGLGLGTLFMWSASGAFGTGLAVAAMVMLATQSRTDEQDSNAIQPVAEPATAPTDIAPLTELLAAQLDLASDTSEKVVFELSDGFIAVKEALGALEETSEASARLRETIDSLHFMLQSQDIVRQQLEGVRFGIGLVSCAHVPVTEGPNAWLEVQKSEIKARYVMQAQFDVHAKSFGEDPDKLANDLDEMFF